MMPIMLFLMNHKQPNFNHLTLPICKDLLTLNSLYLRPIYFLPIPLNCIQLNYLIILILPRFPSSYILKWKGPSL